MSGTRRPLAQAPVPDDLAWVLIDGDNLLHRVRGTRDEGALRWLLPRLRAWRPTDVQVLLMLDGHPEPGEAFHRRVVTGIESQHSGNVDGDTALLRLLSGRPYADRARTILVTDDRGLSDRARTAGGLVRRLDWLVAQLAAVAPSDPRTDPAPGAPRPRLDAPPVHRPVTAGAGRPPRPTPGMVGGDPSRGSDGEPEREPWKPGRGATRKRGNPWQQRRS